MTPRPHNLAFALANTAAALGALYIAFALDLERPYWAMFTVFIIATPISGAVRSKAVFRLLGTVGGAALALLLVPPLVQSPILLCFTISVWVGICLYYSLLDRTPRSYAFMLAGYTAAIVAFSVVDRPERVFETMVARLEEISLGIICGTIAHSVFFPRNVLTKLNERIERTITASALWIADALTRAPARSDARAHQRLAQVVTELHVLYTHVVFETSEVPRSGGIMRALQDRLAVLAAHLTSVQEALAALREQAPARPSLVRLVKRASRWARMLADSTVIAAEQQQESSPPLDGPDDLTDCNSPLELAIVTRLGRLLKALTESRVLAGALRDPTLQLPSDLQGEIRQRAHRTLHRDRGLALLSACAAAVACLIACVLWIGLSWPEGGVAVQFAAIGCSLAATLDKPSKLISAAALGILMALPFGAIYVFAIFPRIDGFLSLALVLTPALLLLSLMQSSEKLAGIALVLAVAFSGALALQPSYQADFANFINSNTAEIAGLLVANTTMVLFRTIDPRWNAARISRAGWRAIRRLATRGETDAQAWSLTMFDRVGLVMSRLRDEDLPWAAARRIEPLRDLRVGINLTALTELECELPTAARAALRQVLHDVSEAYAQMGSGRDLVIGKLRTSIDEAVNLLTTQSPSPARRSGLAALTLLRLDLAPVVEIQVHQAEAAA